MIPQDKFGNQIYDKTYNIMLKYGRILRNFGYKEARSKPNLFYKKQDKITIFADLRGTDIVKIWEDPRPMIFHSQNEKDSMMEWEVRRIMKHECNDLEKFGCPTRFSFYSENEPDGIMSKKEEDGYCKECGKDFENNGLYCSDRCKTLARKKSLAQVINVSPFCEICKNRIISPNKYDEVKELLGSELAVRSTEHHVSYEKDLTITVCSSCHARIHHSNDPNFVKFLPESKRPVIESNYYCTCEKCGGKTKYNENNEHQICYKCKHRCKKCGDFTQFQDKICFNCRRETWNEKNKPFIFRYDPFEKK